MLIFHRSKPDIPKIWVAIEYPSVTLSPIDSTVKGSNEGSKHCVRVLRHVFSYAIPSTMECL